MHGRNLSVSQNTMCINYAVFIASLLKTKKFKVYVVLYAQTSFNSCFLFSYILKLACNKTIQAFNTVHK